MSYVYTEQRAFVFTEPGIDLLFHLRDTAQVLLAKAGAFREQELYTQSLASGDSWNKLACVDYLVERGEIRRVFSEGPRQHNVYVSNYGGKQ